MRRLLGALIGLCLVAQPLLVRLHLALEDHTGGSAQVAIDAAPHDHSYSHPHSHTHGPSHVHAATGNELDDAEGTDRGSHPPHPAEDHLHQLQHQLPAPPASTSGVPLLAPEPDFGTPEALPVAPLSQGEPRIPLRPPPRAPAQPRAPPAIV